MNTHKVKIYGAKMSPATRSVLLTISSISTDYELIPVDLLANEHLGEPISRLNPKCTIPVMDDNGFILCDSHAICQYLVDKYARGHSLYPENLATRSLINDRLLLNADLLYSRFRLITYPILFSRQREICFVHDHLVHCAYKAVNEYLFFRKWLVGDNYTIADYCCLPTITSLSITVPISHREYPFLCKWIKRGQKKWPFYQRYQQSGLNMLYTVIQSIRES